MKILDENGLRRLNQHLQATYAKKSSIGTAAEAPNIQNPTTVWEAINQAAGKGGGDPEMISILKDQLQNTCEKMESVYGGSGNFTLDPGAEERDAIISSYLAQYRKLTDGMITAMTNIKQALSKRGIAIGNYKIEDYASLINNALFLDRESLARYSPGADRLISGDLDCGYYGTVSAAQLGNFEDGSQVGKAVTGTTLAAQIGLTAGTLLNNDIVWHKFTYHGEIIYIAQKPIRHSLCWNDLGKCNAIFGKQVLKIAGRNYRLSLLDGSKQDYEPGNSSVKDNLTEWDALVVPLNASYSGIGWNTKLSDADMGFSSTGSNGVWSYCRNRTSYNTDQGVSLRGGSGGAGVTYYNASNVDNYYGWRPALRFTL